MPFVETVTDDRVTTLELGANSQVFIDIVSKCRTTAALADLGAGWAYSEGTLTRADVGALENQDDQVMAAADILAVMNGADLGTGVDHIPNGLYKVRDAGGVAAVVVLTRVSELAHGASAAMRVFSIDLGTVGGDKMYRVTNDAGSDVVGTDALAFEAFGAGDSTDLDSVAAMSNPADGNVNLAALPATIDDVAMAAGVRFAVQYETNPISNGVYVSAGVGAAAVRAIDMASGAALDKVYNIFVGGGTQNAGKTYYLDATAGLVVDTDALVFELSSSDVENVQMPIYLSPALVSTDVRLVEEPSQVIGVKVIAETSPSTAGTYTLTVTGAGNSLLLATFDLTSLVDGAVSELTLTGTAADLLLDEDDLLTVICTSNNLDLTGAGLLVVLQLRSR